MQPSVLFFDNKGWTPLDENANVTEFYSTPTEALMASLTQPTTEWQSKADGLLTQLRVMLTQAGEVNEFFAANDILPMIVASLQADPTGAGIVEGTTYTAVRAVSLMALMADIEAFLAGNLTPIEGLPIPPISRRVAVRRTM